MHNAELSGACFLRVRLDDVLAEHLRKQMCLKGRNYDMYAPQAHVFKIPETVPSVTNMYRPMKILFTLTHSGIHDWHIDGIASRDHGAHSLVLQFFRITPARANVT